MCVFALIIPANCFAQDPNLGGGGDGSEYHIKGEGLTVNDQGADCNCKIHVATVDRHSNPKAVAQVSVPRESQAAAVKGTK